jgi:hypothetical protein
MRSVCTSASAQPRFGPDFLMHSHQPGRPNFKMHTLCRRNRLFPLMNVLQRSRCSRIRDCHAWRDSHLLTFFCCGSTRQIDSHHAQLSLTPRRRSHRQHHVQHHPRHQRSCRYAFLVLDAAVPSAEPLHELLRATIQKHDVIN